MKRRAAACWTAISAIALGCASQEPKPRDAAAERAESARELIRRGEASARVGDMTRAEQYFVAARELGADEKAVVERLLAVCLKDHRYPVALEYAEQYLRRHPSDMDVAFATASIYAAIGDRTKARALLEKILRVHPEWADAHYVLATVLRDCEEPSLADTHDLQYLRLAPNGPLAEVARARLRRSAP